MKDYMAIDQYGETEHALGAWPRAELLRRCGRKSARKMYRDDRHGQSYHVGWIVSGRWFSVYHVEPMRKEA